MYESCMTNNGCKCSEKDLMWPVVEIRRKIQMQGDFLSGLLFFCCYRAEMSLKVQKSPSNFSNSYS